MEANADVNLPDGTRVLFNLGHGITGNGIVRGIALTGSAVIGKAYIVQWFHLLWDDEPISLDYSCLAVFEYQIMKMED